MDPVTAVSVAAAACQFAEQMVAVCDEIFDYIQKVKGAPKLARKLHREAILLSGVLENLYSALGRKAAILQKADILPEIVKELEETLEELSERLKIEDNELSWKRLRWPFDQKNSENLFEKLERFKNTFQLALQIIQTYEFTKVLCLTFLSEQLDTIHQGVQRIDHVLQDVHNISLGNSAFIFADRLDDSKHQRESTLLFCFQSNL
jgi:hypothetical protein